MNEELKALLKEAYDRGATREQLDAIVERYNASKKKEEPIPSPSLDGVSASPEIDYGPDVFTQGVGVSSEDQKEEGPTVGQWFGNIYNGLVEGVQDFLYPAAESTGMTDKNILSFIEQKQEEYPELYDSYLKSLEEGVFQKLGYEEEKSKELAARTAYSKYWESNKDIENEVMPFIREERREKAVKKAGVEIPKDIKEELDEQFWNSSLKGLMSSLPAMIASPTTMGGSFVVQSYYSREEEIGRLLSENPELEMSNSQKEAYKITGALVEGALEKVGLSGALKGSPAITNLVTSKVLDKALKSTRKATKETIDRYINESVQEVLGRVAGGSLAEFETGGLQQLSDDAIKEIVNTAKGKEFFDPKSLANVFKDALYAGAQEAVGGGVISSVATLGTSSREQRVRDINEEIESLKNKRDASQTEGEKAVVDEVITDLKTELNKEVRDSFKEYEAFSEKDINKIADLNSQIADAAAKYKVAESESLKDKYKKEIIGLRAEKKEIEDKYDSKKEERVPSPEREAEAPVEAEPVVRAGEEEVAPDRDVQAVEEEVAPVVAVAPFFNTTVESIEDAATLRENKNYIQYKNNLSEVGKQLGIEVEVQENVGGYKNDAGEEIVEISNRVILPNATLNQAEEYAALVAALAPETQESTIAAQYVEEGSDVQNGNEYIVKVSDTQGALNALKAAGITDFSVNENTGEVSFFDIFDFSDGELQNKIGTFVQSLEENNIDYEGQKYRPIQSNFIDKGTRKEILGRAAKTRSELRQDGTELYRSLVKAIENDANFQGVEVSDYTDADLTQLRELAKEPVAVEEKTKKETAELVIEEAEIKPENVVSQKDAEGKDRFFAAFPVEGRAMKVFFEVEAKKDGTIARIGDKPYGSAKKTLKRRLLAEAVAKPKGKIKEQLETVATAVSAIGKKADSMVSNFNNALKSIGAAEVAVYPVSNDDMKSITGSTSRAQFRVLEDGTSAIILNTDKATLGSLSHEMLHAYVKAVKLTGDQIVSFTDQIRTQLSKGNNSERALAKKLQEFQEAYIEREVYGKGLTLEDPNIAEEFLAEYAAQIKDGIDVQKMSLSTIEKIRKAVTKILNDVLGIKVDDTAIKSKEEAFDFINGFLDAVEGRVAVAEKKVPEKKPVTKKEPVSKEQIDAIKLISSETPREKAKKESVAEVLNGFSESQLPPNSSEQDLISRFLNNIFEESSYTLKKGARESGMTWYIEDITEFENKMTALLPELSDPNQMKLFKQVLAITSSGTNPNQNLQTAYTLWVRSNGEAVNFAKNWGQDKISFITKKGVAIGTGVIIRETKTKYVVQKVDALGNPEVFKNGTPKLFEAKKSNLKEGYPKPAGFTARGNIVAQQLTKIEKVYESVGKDIDKLIEFFEKPQPVSELRKYNKGVPDADGNVRKVAVGKRNGAFIFGEKIGAFYQNMIGIGDTITMDLWWSRTWNRYMGTMLSTVDGKQIIQETPRTDRERDVMRKAVTLAAKKLNLDVSELQAVIWYFEQELWTKAGNVSPSFSYVTAVEALNSKIKTDEQTQKRFSEAGADLTAAEKRRQDAIARADNIIAQGGIQGAVKEQISEDNISGDAYSNFEENKDALFQSDVDAQVDADVSQEDTWKQRDRTLFERFVDLTRRKIQDKYRNIIIIQEDIEYATGKPVGLDQDFENAETLMHGKAKNELEKTDAKIQDIVSKIKKSGLSVDEVNDLLYAMHAQERNRYLRVISTDVGKSLSEMRKQLKMKPSEVADILGIPTQEYIDVEANKISLDKRDLFDVLLIYGTTPSRFFYDYALVKNGSGMTDVEAREILAKYDLDLTSPDVSQLSSKIRPVILAVRDLTADTRRRLVESGLESELTIDAFTSTYKNYVPLRGFADEEFSSDIIEGGRVLEVRARERKAKGRATRADSPLTQAISANTTTIIRAAKNEVLQKLYNLAKENPNKEVYEVIDPEKDTELKVQRGDKIKLVAKTIADYIQDPKTVSVRFDGDYKFIKFTNEELAKTLTESSTGKANIIRNLLGSFNRYLSKMITSYNPAFIFLNFTRDIQSAWLNALAEQDIEGGLVYGKKIANDVVKDVAEAVKVIYGVEGGITGKGLSRRFKDKASKEMLQYYKDFKEDGATTQWFYSKPISELKKDIDALMNPRTSFKDGLKAAAGTVERINLSFENASRLSAYANARRAGVSREKAAQLAKNITVNFNKSGEWSGGLNSYFMFFNAAVQGGSRLFRSLRPRVIKDSDGNRSYHLSTVQKVALGQFLLGMAISFLNEAASDDDEDGRSFYSKIPDYVKERNVVIMNPFNGKDYFTIPMPYGFNIFHSSGVFIMDGMQKLTSVGDVYNNIIQGFIGATVPINFPNSDSWNNFAMKMVSPTALQWFTSLSLNEDYFGQTIYNENFPGDPTPLPQSELGRKSGRQATQAMVKWLNKITGGSEFRSGFIDVNPDQVDFVLEFLTGGAGKFTLRSYGVMEKIFSGNWDKIEARQVPFLRTFYGQPYKYTDISDFYDRYYLVNQMREEVVAGIITGSEAKRVNKIYYQGKKTKKILSNLKKKENSAMKIKDAEAQEARIDALERMRYKNVAQFNKMYETLNIDKIK